VKQYNFILYLLQRDGKNRLEKSHKGNKQTLCENATLNTIQSLSKLKKEKFKLRIFFFMMYNIGLKIGPNILLFITHYI
jgi:hypothetical protein